MAIRLIIWKASLKKSVVYSSGINSKISIFVKLNWILGLGHRIEIDYSVPWHFRLEAGGGSWSPREGIYGT